MNDKDVAERRLLEDVVHDDSYAALRREVQTRCLNEIRERRKVEARLLRDLKGVCNGSEAGGLSASTAGIADPDYAAFRETVHGQCMAALRRPRGRIVPFALRMAAAAAMVVLLGTWALLRLSKNEPQTVERVQPVPVPIPMQIPDRPSYVVVSRPVPPGMVVRTADHKPKIEYIDDEQLLKAVPGIAIARVGDPHGVRKIIIAGPGRDRILLLN